jgi:outer membrane protein TolC
MGMAAILALTAVVLAPHAATPPATPDPGPRFTLEQAIERALQKNLDLREALADVDIAEADVKKAHSGRLPRIEYLHFFGIVNEAKGDAVFSPNSDQEYLNGLGPFTRLTLFVVQPLYTFGRIRAGERAAAAGLDTSRAARGQKRAEIAFSVGELFHNVVLNQKLGRELGEVEKGLASALEKAQQRLDEGEEGVTQVDVLRLQLGVDEMRQDLVKIKSGERLSRAALGRLLALPQGATFELVPPGADDRTETAALDIKPLDDYASAVGRKRPELVRLDAALAAKRALEDKAEAELYPSFFFMGVLRFAAAPHRTNQTNPFVRDDFNYLDPGFVVGMNWNFNWGLLADLDRARAERAKLEATRESAIRGIALELERAHEDVTAADERLTIARTRRKTARSLTALAVANFELGLEDAKTVLETLDSHAETTSSLYLAIRDYNTAVARLQQAAGLLPE